MIPDAEVEMFKPERALVRPLPLEALSLLGVEAPFARISDPVGVELGFELELEGKDRCV